jgi:hypothetical protein
LIITLIEPGPFFLSGFFAWNQGKTVSMISPDKAMSMTGEKTMNATEPSSETAECRLSASLALLRISLGLFLLVWAIMKFVLPKGTINIFKNSMA